MRTKLLLTVVPAAALLAAAPAAAQPIPSSGLETAGTKVDDAALADMRGKFITPSNVSYFGIQMQTSWQRPDGVTTAATLLLSVDFAKAGSTDGAKVQVLVGWNHDGDNGLSIPGFGPAAAGTYVTVPAGTGGLGSVQGAVQSQQISGSDNRVGNNMSIAIVPVSSVGASSGEGLTPVTAGGTHQLGNGTALQLVVEKSQMGIVMSGGTDQVRQMLDGVAGQAAQNVLLNSSGNTITNNMGVTVGYGQLDQAGQVSIQNSLTALKGWGF